MAQEYPAIEKKEKIKFNQHHPVVGELVVKCKIWGFLKLAEIANTGIRGFPR